MNIQNNNINQLSNLQLPVRNTQTVLPQQLLYNNTVLPSVYALGQSQINTSMPVSYTKLGEISVPGLKDKASIYKLANGQRVVIAPKKGSVFVRTTYNVGSMNEPDKIRGISHFIEHNLFNGSKNLAPKEYDKKVSALGGDTNASTSFSYTDYYLRLQPLNDNSLEEAIKINAEQTQFPTFPNEQLIKEKEPVKSEIDMCNDDPATVAICKTIKNLFKIQSSSEDFIIGTKDNINSFNRDTVLDYFNTWYTPDNALTVITGDVNPDAAINLAAKYYNKKNDYSNIHKRIYEPLKYNDKPIREDIYKANTTQPSVTMGFIIPEGTPDFELNKISALFRVLTSKNSNMYKSLDKLSASFDFSVEDMQNKPQGAKAILLTVNSSEENLENAIKTVYSELTNISNYPPSAAEVNNVKKQMTNDLLAAGEDSETLNSVLTGAVLNNNYDYFNFKMNAVNQLTPADISLTARNFLDLNKVSMCVSHHKCESNAPKNQQVSFGAKISPINNIKEITSKIQQVKLPNNIESTVINGSPYVKSVICMSLNTDELNGISSAAFALLNEMLSRGSILRGADNYNSVLNSKDISQDIAVDTGGLGLISSCNTENIQETLALLKEKIMYPNFTQEEFERAKKSIEGNILAEPISAFDKLYKELYPQMQKYQDKETRLKELEALTLNDIRALYSKILSSSSVQALMSAPVDSNPQLTHVFNSELAGGLPAFKPFTLERGENYKIYSPILEPKTLTQEREQAQAEVVRAYKFPKSNNIEDIAKVELLNMILGSGGMSSRLFLDLREDKKLAYSVKSMLDSEKNSSAVFLKIGTTTESPDYKEGAPDNINKALDGFDRNVNLLKTQNVSEKELEDAKTKYKTRILNALETNMDKSLSLLESKYSYYGISYNEKLFKAIDKITADDIRAAANYVFKNPPITSIAASKNTLKAINLGN